MRTESAAYAHYVGVTGEQVITTMPTLWCGSIHYCGGSAPGLLTIKNGASGSTVAVLTVGATNSMVIFTPAVPILLDKGLVVLPDDASVEFTVFYQ